MPAEALERFYIPKPGRGRNPKEAGPAGLEIPELCHSPKGRIHLQGVPQMKAENLESPVNEKAKNLLVPGRIVEIRENGYQPFASKVGYGVPDRGEEVGFLGTA